MHTILNSYKTVAILDGILPTTKLLARINWRSKVIAVDGALIKAQAHGIKVDYLVGDLDAIRASKFAVPDGIKIHHDPDQDSCDFEKCIAMTRAERLGPTLVIGISGGEIDHIISNIHVLIKHHRQDGEFFFLDNDGGKVKLGIALTKSQKISCEVGRNVSIFPYPDAVITTSGLQYPLENAYINQTKGVLCSRNKTIAEEMEIIVHQGVVLVILDVTL